MSRLIGLAAAITLLLSTPATAATWYVNTGGSGDAPTIAAAVDSAVAGDTVLVAAGNYYLADVRLKPGIVLTSESGPYVTKIVAPTPTTHVGVTCWAFPLGHPYTEVSGFWYEGYMHSSGAGLTISSNDTVVHVKDSIFTGNLHGLWAGIGAQVYADNCTFFGNTYGIYIEPSGANVDLSYSIMWDHIFGKDHVYSVAVNYRDLADVSYVGYWFLNEDAQFCGEAMGNVFLQSDSPCAPGNHYWNPADMRVIGALPVGCSTVNTKETSWGQVKALYRGGP